MAGRPPGRSHTNTNATPTPSGSPLIQQMAQAMTQLMEAQGRVDRYPSFNRHDLPIFSGGRDPMIAEEWLDQLEEIFRISRSVDQDKVELATYRRKGEAAQWSKRYREHMVVTGGNMIWEGFKTLFLNKYFPTNVKDQKQIEYLTLQHGDMTIDEYVAKFEILA